MKCSDWEKFHWVECYSLMAAGGNDLLLVLCMQQSAAEAAAQALHSVCMFSPLHECVYVVVVVVLFSFFWGFLTQRYTASHHSVFFFSKDSNLDIVVDLVGEVLLLRVSAKQSGWAALQTIPSHNYFWGCWMRRNENKKKIKIFGHLNRFAEKKELQLFIL